MDKVTVEIPDKVSARLREIAQNSNTELDIVIKDILSQYAEEVYEDYLLGKIAKERLKDLDKAVEVTLGEL